MLDLFASLIPTRYWIHGCRTPGRGRCDHSPAWHNANLTYLGRLACGVRRSR